MPKNDIFKYVDKKVYEKNARELKDGEVRSIYDENGVQIDIKKINEKVYKFINICGENKFEVCLRNMYSLR